MSNRTAALIGGLLGFFLAGATIFAVACREPELQHPAARDRAPRPIR